MITRKDSNKTVRTERLLTKLVFHKFKVIKLERRLERLGVNVKDEKPKKIKKEKKRYAKN